MCRIDYYVVQHRKSKRLEEFDINKELTPRKIKLFKCAMESDQEINKLSTTATSNKLQQPEQLERELGQI